MSSTLAVFEGLDDTRKEGVWVTDGSAAGTSELVSGNLNPHDFTVFGNKVLFAANGQASPGSQHLWITDGTVSGTSELNVPGSDHNFDVRDITSIGGKALFYGVSAATGLGLWVTDGTSAGTSEIVHAYNPQLNLTKFGTGALFGSGTSTYEQHLWTTDGTTAGTSDITPGIALPGFTVVGAQAYFVGGGLWTTDGTAAGTSEVTISGGAPSLTPDLTAFGNKLLFEGLDTAGHLNLFITDGTTAGTSELNIPAAGSSLLVSNITTLGGKALFTGAHSGGDVGLWVTDGTVGGTSELFIPGEQSVGSFSLLNPADLTLFGTRVLFAGNDSRGKEGLWITDGTVAGTTEIFAPPLTWSGINPHAFTVSGNEAYFLAQGANRQVGVWVTDGTTAGTSEVSVPHVSLGGLNPQEIVSFNALCFHHGTRIATPAGESRVQDLRAGDLVLTADGAAGPVRWIGERRLDLTRHPDPATVSPIRILRGAVGPDVPRRDLLVSPDHAMFLDGLLIPARLLVNGATILRETGLPTAHYFHVELDTHGILIAEGAPSESYLDTGNRGLFDNAGVPLVLHPDFLSKDGQAIREQSSCAPFAADAARVRPVWDWLAERAGALGYGLPAIETIDEPDLRVMVGRREVRPVSIEGDEYVFALPRERAEPSLRSRATAPCDAAPWIDDRRRLGVMVRRITLEAGGDVRTIAPDDPSLADGWWEAERDAGGPWRWTNGDAVLPLPAMDGPALLRVVCRPAAYPVALSVEAPDMRRVA